MTDTFEVRRKGLCRHFRREVDGDDHNVLVMIIFVPGRLVPIGIKPLAYRGHPTVRTSLLQSKEEID